MSDLNAEAKQYLEKYKEGGELNKPWAFAKALNVCRLDGSVDSLDRLELLLVQIHTRFKPDASFLARADVKAFLRLLAYSIGQMIADQSGNEVTWHSYESAVKVAVHDPLPREAWSEVMGVIASSPCVPLGLLIEYLTNGQGSMRVKEYAERLISRYTAPPPMDENQRCQAFLRAFSEGNLPYGGLMYADELVAIRLDYSLQSLEDLDRLVLKIRTSNPPDFAQVMGTSSYVNFLLWCSYYFAACIARKARIQMKWLSYEEAKSLDPSLDRVFITHHVCLLGGRMYFPLAPFCVNLFQDPNDRQNVAAYASQIIANFPDALRQISVPRHVKSAQECASDLILEACYKAGSFAGHCLWIDSPVGRDSAPRLLQGATGSQQSVIVDFSFYQSGEQAAVAAESTMEHNPERRPFLAYAVDSYANLVTGRKDALTVQIKIFPPKRFLQKSDVFEMMVMLPYQKPVENKPFQTYSPILQHCSLPQGLKTDEAVNAFVSGLLSFKVQMPFDKEEFTWLKCLDPQPLLD